MKLLFQTHDLSCTFTELSHAALRHASQRKASTLEELTLAAVALTIQLAIDVGGRDPAELRALECELMDKLRAA